MTLPWKGVVKSAKNLVPKWMKYKLWKYVVNTAHKITVLFLRSICGCNTTFQATFLTAPIRITFVSMTTQGSAEKKWNLRSTLTVGGPVSFLNLSYNEVQRKAKTSKAMQMPCVLCSMCKIAEASPPSWRSQLRQRVKEQNNNEQTKNHRRKKGQERKRERGKKRGHKK